MDPLKSEHYTRRAFLRRASALTALGAGAPLAMSMATMADAASITANDYKALVCVFMLGGNDYGNTLIPYDAANYARYSAIRGGGAGGAAGGIAYGLSDIAATQLSSATGKTLTDGVQYALNPSLGYVNTLWNSGAAAALLNVGPLIVPLTLAQYQANGTANPIPPRLFSHNDQQSTWQSDGPEGTNTGWGGRIGDLALSTNGVSSLTSISAAGDVVFGVGLNALEYRIAPSGAIPVNALTAGALSSSVRGAVKTLITQTSSQTLENEYAKVVNRSVSLQGQVSSALAQVNLTTNFNPSGVANPLAQQMKVVAQMIAARNTLGMKRQVFFISLGNFDTHDALMTVQPPLLAKVSEALYGLYQATVEMGIANQVTAFTASDFGRTLASNGDGTDHGWGSHHFIVGGAVKGGQYFGTAPHVSVTSNDQVGQGRLLPSTATDQMAATLASWFGVANSDLPLVNPNIVNFSARNLGFMNG